MILRRFKGKVIACFSKKEIEAFMMGALLRDLPNAMASNSLSLQDVRDDYSRNNFTRIENLTSGIGKKIAEDKNEHEVFLAAFILLDFYEDQSEVCFELKNGYDSSKNSIKNFDDLNRFREEATDVDCIIKTVDVYRPFQLKRYRKSLNSKELSEFVIAKLAGYAKSMGTNNLLIVLQSAEDDLDKLDWNELHQTLKKSNLILNGEILIAYNENNQTSVINQVFPELATSRIPIQWRTGRPPDVH